MVLECTSKTNEAEAMEFLRNAGALDINVQHAEEGWWLGRYDKERKLFEDTKTETVIA
jgi:hypothetical protein